ncbi:AtpZ/AtpI family protein [Bacteroidota bacterium]
MYPEDKSSERLARTYRDIAPYLGLGTQLAATIIIMFFIGKWLDDEFDLFPFLTILLSFLGGFAGIYNFIRTVLLLNEKKKNNTDN